jgi:hypothetical protein
MNIFICNKKDHECDSEGIGVILLRNGAEVPDTPENEEKYKDLICGGSCTCSICGQSAISKAMWL